MKYAKTSQEEAEEGWKDVYEASLSACMHGPTASRVMTAR